MSEARDLDGQFHLSVSLKEGHLSDVEFMDEVRFLLYKLEKQCQIGAGSKIIPYRFNPQKQIAIIWDVDDVLSERPDLTEKEAMAVLQAVEENAEANYGVSFTTLRDYADEMFPQIREEE